MCAARARWPAVPRPIAGEAFGSWLGRIAARYRIDVDALARCAQLELDLGRGTGRWIAAAAPTGQALANLAQCTGVGEHEITCLAGADSASAPFRYCFKCLVLNPEDVFAPYWKQAWFDPNWGGCPLHPHDGDAISSSALCGHKNMRKLLHLAGRRRAQREIDMAKKSGDMLLVSGVRGRR